MGMYDYINGEQVKCFYNVFWYDNSIVISGGNLCNYEIGEEVPLVNLHYKYPKDMCIYDHTDSEQLVHIIKDGKVKETTTANNITREDIGDMVVNYYGKELNVKSIEDFELIFQDYNLKNEMYLNTRKKYLTIEKSVNINSSKEEKEEWIRQHDLFMEELESLEDPMKKWFNREYDLEKQLGEYISCLCYLDVDSEEYKRCYDITRQFMLNNDGIFERYLEWVKLDEDNESFLKNVWYKDIMKEN